MLNRRDGSLCPGRGPLSALLWAAVPRHTKKPAMASAAMTPAMTPMRDLPLRRLMPSAPGRPAPCDAGREIGWMVGDRVDDAPPEPVTCDGPVDVSVGGRRSMAPGGMPSIG